MRRRRTRPPRQANAGEGSDAVTKPLALIVAQNAVALAQAAEAAGFETVWTVEHTIIPAA